MRMGAVFCLLLASHLLAAQGASAGNVSSGTMSVEDAKLFYEECGRGPAVVLLHDGLLHSVTWDGLWPGLCTKYHVIRYDRRGYGRSTPSAKPYHPEDDLFRVMH